MTKDLSVARPLAQLHRELSRRVLHTGLRKAGRLLGDDLTTNRNAMRLHRMLKSPTALGLAPFYQVLRVCRVLGVHVRT